MVKKKKTVEFTEGWADELLADGLVTEEELNMLRRGIIQMVETGEILTEAFADDDLTEEEMRHLAELASKPKPTQH